MPTSNKILHPVTGSKLRPSTDFGGTQVRDESTNYSGQPHGAFSKHPNISGSRNVPGAGHSVKNKG